MDVARLETALDAFLAAGTSVYVTEVDVVKERSVTEGAATITGALSPEQQASLYADYLETALHHPAVLGFTLWGHKQDRMWGSTARQVGESDASYWARGPGLYDDQHRPKPAYDAVVQVLEDYYVDAGCDYLPASHFAKVTGGDSEYTIAARRFGEDGPIALRNQYESVGYLFNSPYSGHWQLDLELERDTPGDNTFEITVDAANPVSITLASDEPDGTVFEVAVYSEPIALTRGAHLVRIAYGPDTYTCEPDAWSDACDGNGVVHGVRLRRVRP